MKLGRKIGEVAGWVIMRLIATLVMSRGPAFSVGFGRLLGRILWAFINKRKKLCLKNAEVALPHLSSEERYRVMRESIVNSIPYWPETVCYSYRGPEHLRRTVSVEGLENLDAALAKGKGVVAPGIHLGMFPLMAARMMQGGYDFQFLSRFPHNERAVQAMATVRAKTGIRLIKDLPRRQCLIDCREVLGRNGIIGMQLDQRAMSVLPGVDVDYFGRKFHAFGGMISMALKNEAPLVPMYIYRKDTIHHHLVIEPEIEVDHGLSKKKAVHQALQALMHRFEDWVRAHPEQYWWPHHFWDDV